MTTLVLSSRHTDDNQALWRAAIRRGWCIERARGIRIAPITDDEIVIYVESLFAQSVAESLGRTLPEIDEQLLPDLPDEIRNREITKMTLGDARQIRKAVFVKPPNDKSFAARVYQSGAELPHEFDDRAAVLVSEPVKWSVEFRCFCLDGVIEAVSPYLRNGELAKLSGYEASQKELDSASSFASHILEETATRIPRAVVIDVGIIDGKGWSIVEANAAWGSGIYGCDPDSVLKVIRQATINKDPINSSDQ